MSKSSEHHSLTDGTLPHQNETASQSVLESARTEFSNRSRPSRIEIINSLSTVILVFVTTVYVILTFMLLKTTQSQLELTQEPNLSVTPEKMVKGEVAKFDLNITNSGVVDVRDVEIYLDYFVAVKADDQPLGLYSPGFLVASPDTTIKLLGARETEIFHLEFAKTYSQMRQFYLSDLKGAKMMVIRLLMIYQREIDGREFEMSKVYIIAGDGSILFDDPARQLDFGPVTLQEVKAVLGVK